MAASSAMQYDYKQTNHDVHSLLKTPTGSRLILSKCGMHVWLRFIRFRIQLAITKVTESSPRSTQLLRYECVTIDA